MDTGSDILSYAALRIDAMRGYIPGEEESGIRRELDRFLKECGLRYTHLNYPSSKYAVAVRGSGQRNTALEWLRRTYRPSQIPGVVYFADDDNTYHPKLFKEMEDIKRGGTWPVGFIANSLWEGCITCPYDRKKISGFWTLWKPTRKFPIDMAAFAVHLDVVLTHPNAYFNDHDEGMQEGIILTGLGFESAFDLEPKAGGCTKLLVWHTKSLKPIIEDRGPNTIIGLF
ncbi:hypothetical protein ACTXT7_017125 [Hymenolepis weldensis]